MSTAMLLRLNTLMSSLDPLSTPTVLLLRPFQALQALPPLARRNPPLRRLLAQLSRLLRPLRLLPLPDLPLRSTVNADIQKQLRARLHERTVVTDWNKAMWFRNK